LNKLGAIGALACGGVYSIGLLETASFNSQFLCVSACLLLSILALTMISKFLLEGCVNVYNILAYVTLLSYLSPMVNAYFTDKDIDPKRFNDLFFSGYEIFLMTIPVLVVGLSKKNDVFIKDFLSSNLLKRHMSGLIAVVAIISALQVVLLLTNQWTYGTLTVTENPTSDEQASPLLQLAVAVTGGVSGFSGLLVGALLRDKHWRKLSPATLLKLAILVAIIALQILWWLPLGRRVVVVQLALAFVAFLGSKNEFILSRRTVSTYVLSLLVFLPVAVLMSRIFVTLRLLNWSAGGGTSIGLFELLTRLNEIDPNDVDSYQAEAGTRALIIYSYEIVRSYIYPPLGGLELLTQVINAIPSFLIPKTDVLQYLGGAHEQLWANTRGIPMDDYAQTLLLEGYVDFSFIGFVVYAFVVSTTFRFGIYINKLLGSFWTTFLFFYSYLYSLMQVETEVSSIFGVLRMGLTLALASFLVLFLTNSAKYSKISR
jgi:hypothetical protein